MCLAMYLFTDNDLLEDIIDGKKNKVYIQKIQEGNDKGALKWKANLKNMYYIGSRIGCGCGWSILTEYDEEVEKNGKVEDRKTLRNILNPLSGSNSFIIVCWEGDQGKELIGNTKINIKNVDNPEYEFVELMKYELT